MDDFLADGGAMAGAIRRFDWSTSPIDTPERWPSVLKTSISLILASRFPQCIVWGPSLVTIPNDAFLPILGDKPAALGRPFSDVWREVWPSLEPIVAQAFAGEPTYIEDWPLVIDRHGHPEHACFTFCYSPIRDADGRVVGMLDTVNETTDKVLLLQRQELLSGELGHRLKNLLTVVQAIAGQTIRRAADLAEAERQVALRLAAIGRASDVLTASHWADAELHELVGAALAAHGHLAERVRMAGPPVRLSAQVALAFALALHELTTNAIKYGALSSDAGQVDLRWSIERAADGGEPRFVLVWREQGGPPVTPPARTGFGSMMIERSLRTALRGEAAVRYNPDGLVFRIDAPFAATQG